MRAVNRVFALALLGVPAIVASSSSHLAFSNRRDRHSVFSSHPELSNPLRDRSARKQKALGLVPPQVNVDSVNPGATLDRNNCLTISVGINSAAECADLQIVHALPSTRTYGRVRTPTLIYSSQQASPFPIVSAIVTLPSGTTGLTRVEALLSVQGSPRARGSWSGTSWPSSGTARIALGYDAISDPTAIYRYRLDVTAYYGAASETSQSAGDIVVVNRSSSAFGKGWWLAGVESLILDAQGNPSMWVGGDGSSRRYVRDPNNANVWHAQSIDRPETLTRNGNGFARQVAGGTRVLFDSVGRHVATINRLSQETDFAYDALGRLTSISVPPADTIVPPHCEPQVGGGTICYGPGLAFKTYSFIYDGAGYVANINAPYVGVPRTTTTKVVSGRLVSITSPDAAIRQFTYLSTTSGRIASETSPRGRLTDFRYDLGWRLASVWIGLASGDSVVTSLRAAETIGLPQSDGSGATDTSTAYTQLDGPRRDSSDVTLFWLDRYEAPKHIRNALNQDTYLERRNVQFPGLVTGLVAASGLYTTADYDTLGNVTRIIVLNPYEDGQNDTTRYEWDPKWDAVTKIVLPAHDSSLFAYDTLNGNRLYQQPGGDPVRRAVFRYGNNSLLSMAVPAGQTGADSITYDKNGNFSGVLFPAPRLGGYAIKQLTGSDDVGRVVSHRYATNFGFQTDSLVYDVADRVLRTIAIAPDSANPVDSARVFVDNSYDTEGNIVSVSRSTDHDINNVDTITTSFHYDLLNRKTSEISPDGQADSTVYDGAGNATAYISRRRDLSGQKLAIASVYDRLNRVARRIIPEVTYAKDSSGIPTHQGPGHKEPYPYYYNTASRGRLIPADTNLYTYDLTGGIETAVNGAANVIRTYYANGLVKTDAIQIRNTDSTLSGHLFELTYEYDKDGRRRQVYQPAALAPGGSTPTQYTYDPVTGSLVSVTDPLGMRFDFHYDVRGDLDSLTRGGSIIERFGYNSEGLMDSDSVFNRSHAQYSYADSVLRAARMLYDDRNHLVQTVNWLGSRDTLVASYNGFGQVSYGFSNSHGVAGYNYRAVSLSTESITQDGLGNQKERVESLTYHVSEPLNGYDEPWSSQGTQFNYERQTGRLLSTAGRVTYDIRYDSAGNEVFRTDPSKIGDRASYYSADDRLNATDTRNLGVGTYFMRTFEEYRYDALGRRVWVRTRRECDGNPPEPIGYCNLSSVRRTVLGWQSRALRDTSSRQR